MFNPGDTDTDVLVQVQLDDPAVNGTVEPFEVTVPAHRFAVVDLSRRRAGAARRGPLGRSCAPPTAPTSSPSAPSPERSEGVSYHDRPAGGGHPLARPGGRQRRSADVAALRRQPVAHRDRHGDGARHRRRSRRPTSPAATDLTVAPGERVVIDLAGGRASAPARRSRSCPTSAGGGGPVDDVRLARPTSPRRSACRSAAPSRCPARSSTPPCATERLGPDGGPT